MRPHAPSARSTSARRRSRSAAGPSRWKASKAPTGCSSGSKELRGHGRLAGKTRGVLVKCAKPGQELRADLPSIGPADGRGGACRRACRHRASRPAARWCSKVPALIARADALGLFVVGLPLRSRPMTAERPLKIAIVAGEESGDLLGADIVAGAASARPAARCNSSASAGGICRRSAWRRCSTPAEIALMGLQRRPARPAAPDAADRPDGAVPSPPTSPTA